MPGPGQWCIRRDKAGIPSRRGGHRGPVDRGGGVPRARGLGLDPLARPFYADAPADRIRGPKAVT